MVRWDGETMWEAATERLALLSPCPQAAKRWEEGVAAIPGLEVMGSPEMCVIAFKSTRPSFNIYTLNDVLSRKGWHLNALQHPAALHICLTAAHDLAAVDALLQARLGWWGWVVG